MKSRASFLLAILILLGASFLCKAQRIDNRLTVYAGQLKGQFYGTALINEQSFSYPSLYGNMGDMKGASMKILYKVHPFFSLGIGAAHSKASGWEYPGYLNYQGAELKISSLSPRLQIHNRQSDLGVFNRLKCFAELAPVVGSSRLTIPAGLFNVYYDPLNVMTLPESNDPFVGLEAGAGLELALTQWAAVHVSYSWQTNKISSAYYTDSRLTMSQITMGVAVKLMKDKRYIYR